MIYLDYDSTLNDLDDKWVTWLWETRKILITRGHITHWDWIEDNFGKECNDFWKDHKIYSNDIIQPLPDSREFVDGLINIVGKENIFILTATFDGLDTSKDEHINRHFPQISESNIIHTYNKHEYTKNGVLVDDGVHNVESHTIINDSLGIVFDRNRCNGWSKPKNIDKPEHKNVIKNLIFGYYFDDMLKSIDAYLTNGAQI